MGGTHAILGEGVDRIPECHLVLLFTQVNEFIFRDLEHSFEKEAVIVIAEFKPIVLQSMMKFKQVLSEGW